MTAIWESAALRATARIALGSSAARALLGSGALGLGLVSCGGQTIDEDRGKATSYASSGAGNGGTTNSSGNSSRNSGDSNGATDGAGSYGGSAGASGGSVSDGASGVAGLHGGASSGGSSPSAGASGSSSEPEPACVGPTTLTRPPATPGPSEQEFDCCVNEVSSAIQNGSSPEEQELLGSARVVDCCRAIVTAIDIDDSRYDAASRVRTPCCSSRVAELTELYQHRFCTPWGPPMPPSLDWQAA